MVDVSDGPWIMSSRNRKRKAGLTRNQARRGVGPNRPEAQREWIPEAQHAPVGGDETCRGRFRGLASNKARPAVAMMEDDATVQCGRPWDWS